MRLSLIAASTFAALITLPALAEEAAAPSPVTGNFSVVSDYRFRGLSQSYKLPAVQGGIDYVSPVGVYAGTWLSSISGNQYINGASLEWDMYGGYRGTIVEDLSYDVGGLYYYYPGAHYANAAKTKYNNFEVYGALTYKWITAKYSHTLTNFFGTKNETYGGACEYAVVGGNADNCFTAEPGNSKGSGYFDLSANFPIAEKLTLNTHVGHQSVKNYSKLAYTDWKLGVTYDLSGWALGAAVIGTNAKKGFWYACKTSDANSCKKIGENTLVLSVSKTF
jgi:uncharacterized protein (TIGR02001 family)